MQDNPSAEHRAEPKDARITYIGHATVLIEMDGMRILTDPILRDRVTFLRRRKYGKLDPDLYQNIDAILLSHLHHDHLDPLSLKRVGRDVPLLAPFGSERFLRKKGMTRVREMRVGDTEQIGPLTIRATYADHSPQRHPFGAKADCLGFVIGGDYSIYFPGDTDLFSDMENLADDLDVALLPVWGWGPTLGTGHLDPRRAAESLLMLRPRLAIPIHWGALYPTGLGLLNSDYLTVPPQRFAQHAAELAPDVRVQIVDPGKSLSVRQALS